MESAPETLLKRSLPSGQRSPRSERKGSRILFQNKYTHGKQQTRRSREKSSTYQIPGTYLVHTIGRAKNRVHGTWLMRFDKGIKLNRRRPIEGMNGTRRAHHKAVQYLRRKVAGTRRKRYTIPGRQKPKKDRQKTAVYLQHTTVQSSCTIGTVWQVKAHEERGR